ncbi:Ank protein [Bovine papular stomatitis virus]
MESALYDYFFTRGPDVRISEVRQLLGLGADVNFTGGFGNTALHTYLHYDGPDPEVVRCLLEAGAHVDAVDRCCGALAPELYLLNSKSFDAELFAKLLFGPRTDTVFREFLSKVLYGAVVHRPFDQTTERVVDTLVALGADVNARGVVDRTPLHACLTGLAARADTVRLLLRHGADLNAMDVYSMTPLAVLLRSSDATLELVRLLADAGSDMRTTDFRCNTLLHQHAESYRPRPAIFEELIRLGCDPLATNVFGNTPLHSMATISSCKNTLLQPFVRAGLDIDALNVRYGASPLHFATGHRNDAAAAKLVAAGARIDLRSKNGITPLDNIVAHNLGRAMRAVIKRSPPAHEVADALARAEVTVPTETTRQCVAYVVAYIGAAALADPDKHAHADFIRLCLADAAVLRTVTFGDPPCSALDLLRRRMDNLPADPPPRAILRLVARLAVYGPDLRERVVEMRARAALAHRLACRSAGALPAELVARVLRLLPAAALRRL